MGEARRNKTATQALIAQFPECCLCGGTRQSQTREHAPPKSMFDGSQRPNELVVPACAVCNMRSSTSDLIASIVSRWRYDNTEIELEDHNRLTRQLRADAPDVVEEWTGLRGVDRVRARFHLSNQGVYVPPDAGLVAIGERTIPHLTLFAHKITLALYFAKMGKILPLEGALSSYWRSKEDYLAGGLPREIIAMFPEHDFLKQGAWNEREAFEYRFATNADDDIFGCVARCRVGLFVIGMAVGKRSALGDLDDASWSNPADVLAILTDPRFKKRHQ